MTWDKMTLTLCIANIVIACLVSNYNHWFAALGWLVGAVGHYRLICYVKIK